MTVACLTIIWFKIQKLSKHGYNVHLLTNAPKFLLKCNIFKRETGEAEEIEDLCTWWPEKVVLVCVLDTVALSWTLCNRIPSYLWSCFLRLFWRLWYGGYAIGQSVTWSGVVTLAVSEIFLGVCVPVACPVRNMEWTVAQSAYSFRLILCVLFKCYIIILHFLCGLVNHIINYSEWNITFSLILTYSLPTGGLFGSFTISFCSRLEYKKHIMCLTYIVHYTGSLG